jgi:hypothetical protein
MANKVGAGGCYMLNIWLVEGNMSITKANNKNIVIVVDATIEKEGKLWQ